MVEVEYNSDKNLKFAFQVLLHFMKLMAVLVLSMLQAELKTLMNRIEKASRKRVIGVVNLVIILPLSFIYLTVKSN